VESSHLRIPLIVTDDSGIVTGHSGDRDRCHVAAGANMHEFGRFEIADEFSGWLASSGAISDVNLTPRQISI
jgi:hypothetical protein